MEDQQKPVVPLYPHNLYKIFRNCSHNKFWFTMWLNIFKTEYFLLFISNAMEELNAVSQDRNRMRSHLWFSIKSSDDPQVRGRAYRGCDLSKITTIFLFKIFRRSQRDFFKDPRIIFNKNLVETFEDLKMTLNEDLMRSSLEILKRSH